MAHSDLRSIVLLLVLSACTSAERPVAEARRAAPKIPADLKITLERGLCYGSCPSYTVTIDAEGQIEWEGHEHVAHPGQRRKRLVTLHELASLWGRLDAVDYRQLPSSPNYDESTCPSEVTDMSSSLVTIVANGEQRQVYHYHGCEGYEPLSAFTKLEDEIDAVTGTAEWIGSRQ